jgi:hypothetical protein
VAQLSADPSQEMRKPCFPSGVVKGFTDAAHPATKAKIDDRKISLIFIFSPI